MLYSVNFITSSSNYFTMKILTLSLCLSHKLNLRGWFIQKHNRGIIDKFQGNGKPFHLPS
jgi:hypothetical protein